MSKTKEPEVSRRQALMDRKDPPNDPGDPVEIPAGTSRPQSVSLQIQEQIAMQIAKKQSGS